MTIRASASVIGHGEALQSRHAQSLDIEPFPGFEPLTANFLYCPNQFFDVCLPNCSRGVVRVVAYLIRQTLGWVDENGVPINESISVSYDDLIRRAGVSNGAIGEATDAAVAAGFLRCTHEPKPHRHQQTAQSATYELCWDTEGQYVTDLKSFQGFYAGGGNFTSIPNQFFDHILTTEPLSTVKVVGSVIRHTVGYESKFGGRKQVAALSHSYLAKYAKISTGKILNRAIGSALMKGYIECVKKGVFDPRGRQFGQASEYAIKWRQVATSTKNSPKRPAKRSHPNHSKKTSDNSPKRPTRELSKKTSNRNTLINYSLKQQQAVADNEKGIVLLKKEGFDEKTATTLSRLRSAKEIEQQIEWMELRNPQKNRLGMLRRAIEENWPAPAAAKEHEQHERSRRKQEQLNGAQAAREAAITRQRCKRAGNREALLQCWRGHTREQQQKYRQAAIDHARSVFDRRQLQRHTNLDEPLPAALAAMVHDASIGESST